MSTTTPNPTLAKARAEALDPRTLTLPMIMRATRAIRRAYRAWELGEETSPSADDLVLHVAILCDLRLPYDAATLAGESVYDASCNSARTSSLAVAALQWMNLR